MQELPNCNSHVTHFENPVKIIHARIHSNLELDISNCQFGFRNGVGTKEALYNLLRFIMQKKIVGRKSVGRRRTSCLKTLSKWFVATSKQFISAPQSNWL